MANKIYNVEQLVDAYYKAHPDGHYFDAETLRFFGESIATMYLLKGTTYIRDTYGYGHECYTLSRLQKNYPGGARRTYAYFDTETLEDVAV